MKRLSTYFPSPDEILKLSPGEVGDRLLLFFEEARENKQRGAFKRDYIGSNYPVQDYPAPLKPKIQSRFLEGWDWLQTQGMIRQNVKSDEFSITSRGDAHLQRMKDRLGKLVIFYSWQSDLPRTRNRDFIEECLVEAIGQIAGDPGIVIEPSLDRDTQGEPGSPAIADTILSKIDGCDMFVGDISIINSGHTSSGGDPSRPTPNPNVVLELGYAAKGLGWDRITSVFNSAYGRIEDLPFDLKQRRVVSYRLEPGENKKTAKSGLVEALAMQIRAVIAMRS
jgi:hypothetical protein